MRCNPDLSSQLLENKKIQGYQLFAAMILELESLKEDGCDIDDFGIPILKTITAQIYPEDSEYFIRQIGQNFYCEKHFDLEIDLKF